MPGDADNQNQNQNQSGQSGQQGAADWKTGLKGLDESTLKHPSLESFKSVEDVVKSYVAVQPLIGREKIPLPRKDDKGNFLKEDMDIVFQRLGRPEKEDGYQLPTIKLPDGYPAIPEAKIAEFKKKALELGVLPSQAAELFKWQIENSINEYNQFSEQRTQSRMQAEADLRREWGRSFDARMTLAKKVLATFSDAESKELIEGDFGNDTRVVKFLAKIGEKFSEDGMLGPKSEVMMTPEQAKGEILKIQADKNHPYWNKTHPEHVIAVNRMEDLHKIAYEDKQKD